MKLRKVRPKSLDDWQSIAPGDFYPDPYSVAVAQVAESVGAEDWDNPEFLNRMERRRLTTTYTVAVIVRDWSDWQGDHVGEAYVLKGQGYPYTWSASRFEIVEDGST